MESSSKIKSRLCCCSAPSQLPLCLNALVHPERQFMYHPNHPADVTKSTQYIYFFKLDKPSPSFLTTFLGRTSTFLLSKPLNAGLITFGLCSSSSALFPPSFFPFPLILGLPLTAGAAEERAVPSPGPSIEGPLFVPLALTLSTPEVFAEGEVGELERNACVPPSEAFCVAAVFRCLSFGAGKLDFLSMASTVRWKRRKRASARTRVDSRSIVVESSLTVLC